MQIYILHLYSVPQDLKTYVYISSPSEWEKHGWMWIVVYVSNEQQGAWIGDEWGRQHQVCIVTIHK